MKDKKQGDPAATRFCGTGLETENKVVEPGNNSTQSKSIMLTPKEIEELRLDDLKAHLRI